MFADHPPLRRPGEVRMGEGNRPQRGIFSARNDRREGWRIAAPRAAIIKKREEEVGEPRRARREGAASRLLGTRFGAGEAAQWHLRAPRRAPCSEGDPVRETTPKGSAPTPSARSRKEAAPPPYLKPVSLIPTMTRSPTVSAPHDRVGGELPETRGSTSPWAA